MQTTPNGTQMSPLDFVLWMEGLLTNRNALSATDIMSIKEKLKIVNKMNNLVTAQPTWITPQYGDPYIHNPNIPQYSFTSGPVYTTANVVVDDMSGKE